MAERIGLKDGIFSINIDGHKFEQTLNIPDHQVAVELLMDSLLKHKVLNSFTEIEGVGHRVVQGGSYYDKSVVADQLVESRVEEL